VQLRAAAARAGGHYVCCSWWWQLMFYSRNPSSGVPVTVGDAEKKKLGTEAPRSGDTSPPRRNWLWSLVLYLVQPSTGQVPVPPAMYDQSKREQFPFCSSSLLSSSFASLSSSNLHVNRTRRRAEGRTHHIRSSGSNNNTSAIARLVRLSLRASPGPLRFTRYRIGSRSRSPASPSLYLVPSDAPSTTTVVTHAQNALPHPVESGPPGQLGYRCRPRH
jgi:hypothetical protein